MTKETEFELSRRRVLGALGTIGVASAGAGLGTTAYFSDQETFINNELTAGSLDLKVDWEEHYSDWSDDEMNDPTNGTLDIQMSDPGTGYTAFPQGAPTEDHSLWVADGDVSQFMDNTAVEAYPDTGEGGGTADDGVQDAIPTDMTACEYLADVGNDDDGLDPTGPRSNNDDTVAEDGSTKPLVYLDDVKPGDFGEVTFSMHLCTNPGYIWLNADNVSEAENGVTEPEADDPDEDGTQMNPGNDPELADAIQTAWWYDDNCDNLTAGSGQTGSTNIDVAIVLDESGSMSDDSVDATRDAARAFVDELISGDAAASVAFSSGADVRQGLTTDLQAVKDAIGDEISPGTFDPPRLGSTTDTEEAINEAQAELTGPNGRANADNVIVLLSDGGPDSTSGALQAADNAKSAGTRIITLGFGFTQTDPADDTDDNSLEQFLKAVAGSTANSVTDYNDGAPNDDEGDYYYAPGPADVGPIFQSIGRTIRTGEPIFFQGSLSAALSMLSSGNGVPLDGDPSTASQRDCFEGNETYCIGFSWWLPLDHGNEAQTDSVQFDLGFYTEQCRHNDGSGMNNEMVNNEEVDA